jgi:hypothetical protein
MYCLEILFRDNIIDGVTIVYVSYCDILSSSQIVLSSKSYGAY